MRNAIDLAPILLGLVVVPAFYPTTTLGQPTATFIDLGTLPGTSTCEVTGMSADGSVVCGVSSAHGFIWSRAQGLIDLGTYHPVGVGIADGLVVVAAWKSDFSPVNAYLWTGTTSGCGAWSTLPLAGSFSWRPQALGTDGHEVWVVGDDSDDFIGGHGTTAVVSQRSTNTTTVVPPAAGSSAAAFIAASDNGQFAGSDYYASQAVRYSGAECIELPSPHCASIAYAISRDGGVVGGTSSDLCSPPYSLPRWQAPVLWDASNTCFDLPPIPGQTSISGTVFALNGDGTLAGGQYNNSPAPLYPSFPWGNRALIWNATDGSQDLTDLLASQYGLQVPDWTLAQVRAISADGKILAGNGVHGNGDFGWSDTNAGWVIMLDSRPAPPTISRHPADQSSGVSLSVSFSVEATGPEPLSYQWYKGSTSLADDGHYADTATPTLTINLTNYDDFGSDYHCVVSNPGGSNVSCSAKLVLKPSGDMDRDGDVDMEDFGLTQACWSDRSAPLCERIASLVTFKRCLTGAEIPFDPQCVNPR